MNHTNPKRLRYHSSIIDVHSLYTGEEFEKLPESKVIFIVDEESDAGVEPILHIKRTVEKQAEIIMIKAKLYILMPG